MPLLPGAHHREQARHLAAVADEVVVHEEERAARAARVEGVELRDHLVRGLHPRHASEQLDDVAELAAERAAARVLQRVVGVAREVHQVEPGHAREREIGPGVVRVGEEARGGRHPPLEDAHEEVEPALGLAAEDVVGLGEELGRAARPGAADHGALPQGSRAEEHLAHRRELDQHPGDEHRVRPAQLGVVERGDLEVVQPQLPALGQVRRERGQAERRHAGRLADVGEALLEAPVGARRPGLDQENPHPLMLARPRHARITRPAPRKGASFEAGAADGFIGPEARGSALERSTFSSSRGPAELGAVLRAVFHLLVQLRQHERPRLLGASRAA